jgi:hypothetical protein
MRSERRGRGGAVFYGKGFFFGHGEDCACAAQHMFADREERGVMRGMAEVSEPELLVEARWVRCDPGGCAGDVARAVRKLVRGHVGVSSLPAKTRSLRGWVMTAKRP